MPKIKLKPNLQHVEVGIGNLVRLSMGPSDQVEVAEGLFRHLLGFGCFDAVDELVQGEEGLEFHAPELGDEKEPD
jgi:hypothetical protein